jgi:sugar (pentulose or hexulose) kinase
MYNYDVTKDPTDPSFRAAGEEAMRLIHKFADPTCPARAATSALAKLLAWHLHTPVKESEVLLHQVDYIARSMMSYGDTGTLHTTIFSDWHNALKLGYDPDRLDYPDWLHRLQSHTGINHEKVLPVVTEPGREIGRISGAFAEAFGINPRCCVCAGKLCFVLHKAHAKCSLYSHISSRCRLLLSWLWLGTTDSIAAFIASGANRPGQAVTSLGSTLAIKVLSTVPVRDAVRGVYSHRFSRDLWLAGGASNVGCAILKQEGFDQVELQQRSPELDASTDSVYRYYPMCAPGERFPMCDPRMQPLLQPKPLLPREDGKAAGVDRTEYLRALLQGIAYVEKRGYDVLEELGATPVEEVSSGAQCVFCSS